MDTPLHPAFNAAWISFFFFFLGALIHIGFFVMESILFQRPGGHRLFGVPSADHSAVKLWAFNQGFYNLFLALGTFLGLYFVTQKQVHLAGLMIGFCGACMIGAGVVLAISAPHLRRGAVIQILPAALGFFFLSFHVH